MSKVEEVVDKQVFSATHFDAADRLINTATTSFATASVNVKAEYVGVGCPPSFWDHLSTFSESLQAVDRHMQQSLQTHSAVSWFFVFPAIRGWER